MIDWRFTDGRYARYHDQMVSGKDEREAPFYPWLKHTVRRSGPQTLQDVANQVGQPIMDGNMMMTAPHYNAGKPFRIMDGMPHLLGGSPRRVSPGFPDDSNGNPIGANSQTAPKKQTPRQPSSPNTSPLNRVRTAPATTHSSGINWKKRRRRSALTI